MITKIKQLKILRQYYKEEKSNKKDILLIKEYFDLQERNEYTLDDQTWDDLDMNKVFYKLDRSYSSTGESILYDMLRNPLMNENDLKERNTYINLLKENKNLRSKIQGIYYNLGFDKNNNLLKLLQGELKSNKIKKLLYPILGVIPFVFIFLTIFSTNKYLFFYIFVISVVINSNISLKEQKHIHSHGLSYLNDILIATKKLSKLNLSEEIDLKYKLPLLYKELKSIRNKTRLCHILTLYGGMFEGLGLAFLILESSYYGLIDELESKRNLILKLYHSLGEIESLVSISIYQEILEDNYTHPKFVKDVKLEIKNGVHPLLKKPVANAILLDKKGVVLTGTNMSGKSTFLRMIGVNMLLAQTFYFTLTSKYECCFFNIVSSISPKDDIDAGKSYYMAEAEALLRIIEATKKPVPVFCIIDEIFRGTNPVERVAASASILKYISNEKTLTFVATHDRELTDMLKETYDFYYFSEDVKQKEGLSFDYKLKTGISKTRNAIKLLDYIGYPKEITKNARDYAKKLD